MKINDEIIKYLAGNMELSEKAEFEERISKDSNLKLQLEEYKSNLSSIKELANMEAENNYFNGLLPKIRERIEPEKQSTVNVWKKIAFSFPIIMILAFFLYKQFISTGVTNTNDMQTVITKMNDTTKVELLNRFADRNSLNDLLLQQDSVQTLSEEISRELFKSVTVSNDPEVIFIDEYEVINELSRDEAELVYKNLINKKIM